MRRLLPLFALGLTLACRDPRTVTTQMPPPPAPPACGDGVIQEGEDCDGSDNGTSTCVTLGFDMGRVLCNPATCKYDTSLCVKRCGNGVLDLGESCDGTLGLPSCDTWGFNTCSAQCTADTSHCVTQAFDTAPQLSMSKGGPVAIGDFNPVGPGDLVMAVPSLLRVELIPWNMTRGFDATASRKLSFLQVPTRAEIIDVNGDGALDAVTINADGTFDFYVNQGATYALVSLPGAGCTTGRFVPRQGQPAGSVTVWGCDALMTLSDAGVATVSAPGLRAASAANDGVWWSDSARDALISPDGGAFALSPAPLDFGVADLDDDGDTDAVTTGDAGVTLYENTGAGLAKKQTFTQSGATHLQLHDVDGDGRADLVWTRADALVVRRNQGAFAFTEVTVPLTGSSAGPDLSLGDVDGDGDLDVVLTTASGDATTHQVFLNRAR